MTRYYAIAVTTDNGERHADADSDESAFSERIGKLLREHANYPGRIRRITAGRVDAPDVFEAIRMAERDEWFNWIFDLAPDVDAAKLRAAVADAGFAVMQTSGKWSIHDVSQKAKEWEEQQAREVMEKIMLEKNVRDGRLALEQLLESPEGAALRAKLTAIRDKLAVPEASDG